MLKFDGLATGKGVAVCMEPVEAEEFLKTIFIEKRFGEGRLLVEEWLTGSEVSIFAAIVDDEFLILTPARDYKRLPEADHGSNTGGMGAVASRYLIQKEMLDTIKKEIVQPTIKGLSKDKLPYRGFLYFGLMLTPEGTKVIEYNCRFGYPECQAVMPLVRGDLAQFCVNGAQGKFTPELINFSDYWSDCVVAASEGYPDSSHSGDVISGLDKLEEVSLYHAGTKLNAEGLYETNGGRVLAVVSQAPTLDLASTKAHKEMDKVNFSGLQRRSDIGFRAFEQDRY